jgi:hypothetical protein
VVFADTPPPAEPLPPYQCRLKIREQTNQLRTMVEKKVRETVPNVFEKIQILRKLYPYIDELERDAIDCSQKGSSCEECMKPLVKQMELWNSEASFAKEK